MKHVLDRFGNLAVFLWRRGCHGEPDAELGEGTVVARASNVVAAEWVVDPAVLPAA